MKKKRRETTGTDIRGRELTFYEYKKELYAWSTEIISLNIPKWAHRVFCQDNEITFLHVPQGVLTLVCHGNNLVMLELPESVNYLSCDPDLFNYDECEVRTVEIQYVHEKL